MNYQLGMGAWQGEMKMRRRTGGGRTMTMTGIDNIKPPINEKQLKFCYFGNWLVRTGVDVGTWKGVETANAQLAVLQGVCSGHGRGLGEQGCSWGAMPRRMFDPSEPNWEGDD